MKTYIAGLVVCLVLLATGMGQAPTLKDFSAVWLLDLDRSTFQSSNPPVSVRLVIQAQQRALPNQSTVRLTRTDIYRDGTTSGWGVEIANNQVTAQHGFPALTSVKLDVRNGQLVIESNVRFQNSATGALVISASLIDDGATLLWVEQETLGGRKTTNKLYFVRK